MTAPFSLSNPPERQAWGGGERLWRDGWGGGARKRQRGGSFEGERGELKMAGNVREAR